MCERRDESFPDCEDYWYKESEYDEDEYDEERARDEA